MDHRLRAHPGAFLPLPRGCMRWPGTAALVLLVACGEPSQKPAPTKQAPETKTDTKSESKADTKSDTKASSTPTSGGSGGAVDDPFATEGWGDDDDGSTGAQDTEGAGTGDEGTTGGTAAPPAPHLGPCSIRWSSGGPTVRFKYDADQNGGRMRIDGDRDGKPEICGRFWLTEGRTHKVTVDEGCDRSTELTISPTYDDKANLADARYVQDRGGTKLNSELTLVALPSFPGVAPGYPMYAARKDIKLTVKDGKVRKAHVKAPTEGPAIKVDLSYDDQGRIKWIKEDLDANGSVDRRFDYRYDEVGNVKSISLTQIDPNSGEKTKSTGRLSYSCWK